MSGIRSAARWAGVLMVWIAGMGNASAGADSLQAVSTEDFLNRLGVNTHLNGLTPQDPWNTNVPLVADQVNYIGVRLVREWTSSTAMGKTWKEFAKYRVPFGRIWTSIDEGSPAWQRRVLGFQQAIYEQYPGLIYAMGGPNEPDDDYPQQQGATLPDSVEVQKALYQWAHSAGRNLPVSQMEFGAGWTAANGWKGDYDPTETGLHQNYMPGPADFAAAHTYMHQPGQRPIEVLKRLRELAHLTTPGKPVAHTEFGAYRSANFSTAVYGQYLVMGAFDSIAAGDAAYIVYGLQDSGPENTYGFFSYPGNAPHEAATYFHTLTTLLHSKAKQYGPGDHPTFTPRKLDLSYTNAENGHLLLQKPTGEFLIADWSEQVMNGKEHPVTDTIRFGRSFTSVRVVDVEKGLKPITIGHNLREMTLTLEPGDTYLLLLEE